jgi:hypothetical protein
VAAKIRIKPHHLIDIINYYGADSLRLTPHPYGHAYHLVAQRLLDDREVLLQLELGADDICAPCDHNIDGICDDVLDQTARPQVPRLKRVYNLRLDRRWCERLELAPGQRLTSAAFCERLLTLEGDIRDVYREMPAEFAAERLVNIKRGAARYLEET